MQNLIKSIQNQYAYGDCAIFAVAMSKLYKLPIVEFYNDDEMFHIALLMRRTELKSDRFIDVFGVNTFIEIKRRYGIIGKIIIEEKSEEELKIMSLFSNTNIKQAEEDLHYLISVNILPKNPFCFNE